MGMGMTSIALVAGSALACGAGAALALPAAVDALLARKRRKWLAWFDEKMDEWTRFRAQNGRIPGGAGAPASEKALEVWAADARRLAGSDVLGPARSARLAELNLPDPDAQLRAAAMQVAGAAGAQARAAASACVPAALRNGGENGR